MSNFVRICMVLYPGNPKLPDIIGGITKCLHFRQRVDRIKLTFVYRITVS